MSPYSIVSSEPYVIEVAEEAYQIFYTENVDDIITRMIGQKPKWITFDTETTGLHVHMARPFLGAVCWDGIVLVFPTTPEIMKRFYEIAALTGKVFAHNVIFDMCMTANVIGDKKVLAINNWADGMCVARLIFEAISAREGGDKLGLKSIGKKYIDFHADKYEKNVDRWLRAKRAANRKIFIAMLKGAGWTMKRFESDEPKPLEILTVWQLWEMEYPEPTYQDVPLNIMIPYIAYDCILLNILVKRGLPSIKAKELSGTFQTECDLLPAVFKMVRTGFTVDREYLVACRNRVMDYMAILQAKAVELSGNKDFKPSKHALIKDLYTESTGVRPEKVDKAYMKKQAKGGDELAEIIGKLRTCEKWVSTYIDRILANIDESDDGRYYPTLNPYNPVSGRFSGDCQQMPKDALCTIEGEELYHPRKAILVCGNGYSKMAFIDVSQYELRWGAHYTLAFGGDLNLCRAYMPFKCYHCWVPDELFDPYNPTHIDRWDEKAEDGTSVWHRIEDNTPWTPTDVHSSTTRTAFPNIDEAEFSYWRDKGKRFNFLKFYGGGATKAAEALEIELNAAKALNRGFEAAFPLLVTYGNAVIQQAGRKGYVQNLYGRRYYLTKSYFHYKLANYLIQGGTADDFKRKIIAMDAKLTALGAKSRLVHPIHDEIIIDVADGEDWVLDHMKKVIEFTPALNVPVVAEVSTSDTNWKGKKKMSH